LPLPFQRDIFWKWESFEELGMLTVHKLSAHDFVTAEVADCLSMQPASSKELGAENCSKSCTWIDDQMKIFFRGMKIIFRVQDFDQMKILHLDG